MLGWDMGKGRPGPCPHGLRQLWLFPLGQHRPPAQGPHTTCRATLWMPSPDKIGGQGSVPPGESGEGFSETEWWRGRMPWIRHQLQPPKCWRRFKLVKWYLCFLLPSPGTEDPTHLSPLILTKRPNHSCGGLHHTLSLNLAIENGKSGQNESHSPFQFSGLRMSQTSVKAKHTGPEP